MMETRKQVYGSAFTIVAGLGLLLAHFVGMENVWFLYPLAGGIVMVVAPWATGKVQIQHTRIAGAWMALGGLMAGLVTLGGVEWSALTPVWMIAGGLTGLFWKRQAA